MPYNVFCKTKIALGLVFALGGLSSCSQHPIQQLYPTVDGSAVSKASGKNLTIRAVFNGGLNQQSGARRVAVQVANTGSVQLDGFSVMLWINGEVLQTAVASLSSGAVRDVYFDTKILAQTAYKASALVDATALVAETDESDNKIQDTVVMIGPLVIALDDVLAEMSKMELYHRPTFQDLEGRGIYDPVSPNARSETIYPPFILAPRRQTDSLVRELYALLPADVRSRYAFAYTERLCQNPEAYLSYLRSRSALVLMGNFVGIGAATSDSQWFVDRHNLELGMCEQSIRLALALSLPIREIRFTMGDSTSDYSKTVKTRLETRLRAICERYGYVDRCRPVTTGADEMAATAFASVLPQLRVRIDYASTTCRHHYDQKRTSPEVVQSKLAELGIVASPAAFDFRVYVATSVDNYDFNAQYPDAAKQAALDNKTFAAIEALSTSEKSRTVIIDGRRANGGFDARFIRNKPDWLAYSGWGTFTNNAATALATAKIVLLSQNDTSRRRLMYEAIAHDVFANGYKDGRDKFIPLLKKAGITFNHFGGYSSAQTVVTVFRILDEFVADNFAPITKLSDIRFRITAQLWRTFESEVHTTTLGAGIGGVYRTDLNPTTFDPALGGTTRPLTLADIVSEARY